MLDSAYMSLDDLAQIEFAVIDVETTGLFPGRLDRVVEVAVVRATGDGEILDEFETLVNPGRDLGPSSLHGTRPAAARASACAAARREDCYEE